MVFGYEHRSFDKAMGQVQKSAEELNNLLNKMSKRIKKRKNKKNEKIFEIPIDILCVVLYNITCVEGTPHSRKLKNMRF